MRPIIAYAVLLLTGFVLAMLYGLVLVEEIQKVVPMVASKLNVKQQGA